MTPRPNSDSSRKLLAVGYIRCSTDLQEESPDQQKKEILSYADSRGYAVVDWFIDFGKSGTTFLQRPEFQRLRRTVDNNPGFKAVICYDESRWGRAIDAEENTYWRFHFRKRGVDVLLVKTSVDPKNEFAPMLKAFEGVQASQFSKKLSELTLRGAKDNGIYSNGGFAPYGYTRVAIDLRTGAQRELADGDYAVRYQEKVRWKIGKPEEVETIRYIFEERAKSTGYIIIVESLNRRNISCPKRGRWRNRDQKWSTATVKAILDNPTYYGARVYNRNSMSPILAQANGMDPKAHASYPHWRNGKEDWIFVENAHDPIVTKELWDRAHSVLQRLSPRVTNQHSHHSPYLLTGLISCSSCGFAFQGWSGRAKGISYLRYIDGGWKSKRVCTYLAIPKERLENFAINAVRETLAETTTSRKIEEKLQHLLHREPHDRQNALQSIEQAIEDNRRKQQNLIEVLELRKTGANPKAVLERLEELEREKQELEARILSLQTQKAADSRFLDSSREIADFILNFEDDLNSSDPFRKKVLLKKCISDIVVDRAKNVINLSARILPAVTPELEYLLLQNKKAVATKVATAVSSGGPI